jgi:hypothetical protein
MSQTVVQPLSSPVSNGLYGHSQQSPSYSQSTAAYPGAPPPAGTDGVGCIYNPTLALPTAGPYPPNHPNLNTDPNALNLYSQTPPMHLPNGTSPTNDMNSGAAADYYGKLISDRRITCC